MSNKILHEFFQGKIILVAGGTGSIGSEIVKQILKFNPKTIRILSNSENELWETKNKLKKHQKKLRFLLGDIRNKDRLLRAVSDVDYVFNAAAIKHVPISEYNPLQAIDVNINGLDNIITSCYQHRIKKLIHISTDKAVNPTTVMGATKMLGERICISREKAKGSYPLKIACVRFGNVLGSRGSIIPLIKKQIMEDQEVTLTSEDMRRFFMSLEDAVKLVLQSMVIAEGGEIFVLKMPTIQIKDLIEVIIEEFSKKNGLNRENIKIRIIGARPGEKNNEDLISKIEYDLVEETEDMYIINHLNRKWENFQTRRSNSSRNPFFSTKYGKVLKKQEIKDLLFSYNLI